MQRRSFITLLGGAAAAWPLAARAQQGDQVRALQMRVLRLRAEAVADKITQFIREIESQVGWTTQFPWSAGTIDQRRFDGLRLLRQVPAITELAQLDGTGAEQLRISRLSMDTVADKRDYSHDPKFTDALAKKVYYGPVYFPRREKRCEAVWARELSGIGIEVTLTEGQIKVVAPMNNLPAAKAGIMAGDIIVALDDESLRGLPLSEAVERMRGPPDTKVKLTVMRHGHDTPIDVFVTRAVIRESSRVDRCPPVSQREARAVPHMTLSLAGTRRDAGVSVAEINLLRVQDWVAKLEVGEHAVAYVVDSQDRVIAHRNSGFVNADFSSLAQVQTARAGAGAVGLEARSVQDTNGRELLSTYAAIPMLGWLVFVELPATEADTLSR